MTNKQNSLPRSSALSIRFALLLATLTTFIVPIVLMSPLLVGKLLGLTIVDDIGLNSDNFGIVILVSQTIGLIASIAVLSRRLKKQGLSWGDAGLNRFKVRRSMIYIIGYYALLIGIFVTIVVVAVGIGLGDAPSDADSEPGGAGLMNAMGGFWPAFILTVIIAPIVEEIVFRGVLFKSIKRRYGLAAGVIGSSIIFMLVHINPLQMLSALPLGVYLAFMYQRLGSIYPGMILHATWNFLVLMIAQSAANL